MDYEQLASELIRALRGARSQAALSRRLGYRGNPIRTWESARRTPTASKFFLLCERVGRDPGAALSGFFASPPAWLEGCRLSTAESVARLLRDLRGRTKLQDIATRAQISRFSISRWLAGKTEPRLPDFLRLVEATSLRSLDFVACFADPLGLSSTANAYRQLETARRVAIELPWSHAVLRALELDQYRNLPSHVPGFVAEKLGISLEEEDRCLELLALSKQIRRRNRRWVATAALPNVDTRGKAAAGNSLLLWWAQLGVDRLKAGSRGRFSYNLFTVSEGDLVRLRELHNAYFRELRSIVAQSEPAERVVIANLQLFALDE